MISDNDIKDSTKLPEKINEIEIKEKNQSTEIGKLVLALSKAQGGIEGAKEDSLNPFFKKKYADLSSVWKACRNQLSKNELAVIQTTESNNGEIIVTTTLAHSSGQWIRGHIAIKPDKNTAQGLGSALTYGRRYGLSAIVGIAPDDDDDGNEASGKTSKKETSQKTSEPARVSNSNVITDPQRKRLFALSKERDVTNGQIKDHLALTYEIDSTTKILKSDYEDVCDWVLSQNTEDK